MSLSAPSDRPSSKACSTKLARRARTSIASAVGFFERILLRLTTSQPGMWVVKGGMASSFASVTRPE